MSITESYQYSNITYIQHYLGQFKNEAEYYAK